MIIIIKINTNNSIKIIQIHNNNYNTKQNNNYNTKQNKNEQKRTSYVRDSDLFTCLKCLHFPGYFYLTLSSHSIKIFQYLTFLSHILLLLQILLPQVKLCLVTVEGTLIFKGNNAANSEGGALYITTFGQIKLIQGARMIFTDNIGR